MARRGGAPALVAVLLHEWSDRPVELGLAATDLLAMSLYARGDVVVEALRRAAARVEGLSDAALTALATENLQALDEAALATLVSTHAIGGYEVLRTRGAEDVVRLHRTFVERSRGFVSLLHLARLESLAAFFLRYLQSADYIVAAPVLLAELALDRGRPVSVTTTDEDGQGYIAARNAILDGSAKGYHARVLAEERRWWSLRAEAVAKTQPLTRMAEAEIGSMLSAMPFPYEVVDRIAVAHPTWRWGARVRAAMHARLGDAEALPLVADYLARFGSDDDLWRTVFDGDFVSARRQALLALAVQETLRTPHVVANWRALARLLGPDGTLAQQIDASLLAQRRHEVK